MAKTKRSKPTMHTYRVEDAETRVVLHTFMTEKTITEIDARYHAWAHRRAVYVIDAVSGSSAYAT